MRAVKYYSPTILRAKSQMVLRLLCVVVLMVATLDIFSQGKPDDIERIIENITDYIAAENEDETLDIDLLYDDLTYFYKNKIELNTATKEQLERLQFLSDIQIENILAYIYFTKGMKSIYEMQLVDGMDFFTLQLLLPFITTDSPKSDDGKWDLANILRRSRHELFVRTDGTLEQKKGYGSGQYLGSPLYGQFRYAFRAGNLLQAGITAEKDAGEQFWGNHNKGFDSYSAYLQLDNLWKFQRIVVGDFRATFGQGLIVNSAFFSGKSSYVLKVTPSQSGLTRKASTDEFNFFRGAGATAKFQRLTFTALYSLRHYDATVDTATNTFSTLYTSGLFRRSDDWEKRNNLTMRVFSLNAHYRFDQFRIGATLYHNTLSLPMLPGNEPYRQYAFRGRRQSAASLDYYWSLGKFIFFGETALSHSMAVATINGVSLMPTSTVNLVLLHRYYSPKYDLFFAKAFGKSSHVSNENGVYLGVELNPVKRWKLSGYADSFVFPFLKYDASAPSKGFDGFLQVDFMPQRNLNMFLRARQGDKEQNYTDPLLPTRTIANYAKRSLRYNVNYSWQQFTFKSIVEVNWATRAQEAATGGFALAQDIGYNTDWHDLGISLHYVFFDAKNFDNRIYLYERDVPYSMFTPMLYGVGNRYCINLKMELVRSVQLYLRWAQTIYVDGRNSISSGLEEIAGNVRSDLKAGVKIKF